MSDALRLEGNSPNFTKYLSNQYQESIKAGLEQEKNGQMSQYFRAEEIRISHIVSTSRSLYCKETL